MVKLANCYGKVSRYPISNFSDTESETIKKMEKFRNREISKPKRHTLRKGGGGTPLTDKIRKVVFEPFPYKQRGNFFGGDLSCFRGTATYALNRNQ